MSRNPHLPTPDEGIGKGEVHVSTICSQTMISELLTGDTSETIQTLDDFGAGELQQSDALLDGWYHG